MTFLLVSKDMNVTHPLPNGGVKSAREHNILRIGMKTLPSLQTPIKYVDMFVFYRYFNINMLILDMLVLYR